MIGDEPTPHIDAPPPAGPGGVDAVEGVDWQETDLTPDEPEGLPGSDAPADPDGD